tara:strand:+ start:787 stop:1038 length:252 start_codon:yes stop_codon:yes gene_type:complete
MSLTKEIVVDKIEVVGDHKMVQVRTATRVLEDGVVLSSGFHRHVVAPDADITGEDAEVQAVCNAVHTDAVKAAYETFKASQSE